MIDVKVFSKKFSLIYLSLCVYIFYVTIKSKPLNINSNCGFDGSLYCKIALGEVVFEPYSRRTFLPKVISLFPINEDSVYKYFYFINLLIIFCTIILLFLFFLKDKNNNFIYLIILLSFNPNFFRMLESMPVMLDFLALFLTLIYIYIYYTNNQRKYLVFLISIITILVFTRENIPLLLTFSILVHSIILNQKKINYILFNSIIFVYSIFITIVSFSQPSISAPSYVPNTDINKVLIYWLSNIFNSTDDFFRFIYLTFIGLGFLGIVAIMKWRQAMGLHGYIYIFSLLSVISGILLGGDTARIMFIPLVTLSLNFLLKHNINSHLLMGIGLTIIFWDPLQYSNGSEFLFLQMYGQRYLEFTVYEQQLRNSIGWSILFIILFLFLESIISFLKTKKP